MCSIGEASQISLGPHHVFCTYPGERAGFFLGDGAGVGKGRQIAALIKEHFRSKLGNRALWVSVSNDLKYDAIRDLDDVDARNIAVYPKVGIAICPKVGMHRCLHGKKISKVPPLAASTTPSILVWILTRDVHHCA